MRVLVMSDSHGKLANVIEAIDSQPSANTVIFLGDGENDINDAALVFPDRQFYSVRGNCDFCSSLPDSRLIEVEGVRLFFAHGHTFSVKYGYNEIMSEARHKEAKICLFGHTHTPLTLYEDGLYTMNPGSVGRRGAESTYGIIDITAGGIVTVIMKLRYDC